MGTRLVPVSIQTYTVYVYCTMHRVSLCTRLCCKKTWLLIYFTQFQPLETSYKYSHATHCVTVAGRNRWSPRVLPNGTQSQSYKICTLVMHEGSLSPRVLPNGTQSQSYKICTLVMHEGSLSPRVLPNGTQSQSYKICTLVMHAWGIELSPRVLPNGTQSQSYKICTLVMHAWGIELSPRVLPNGTQSQSYNICTLVMHAWGIELSPRVLPNGLYAVSFNALSNCYKKMWLFIYFSRIQENQLFMAIFICNQVKCSTTTINVKMKF